MNNNISRDLQLIEYEQRMVRIRGNDLNNRQLIEYEIAYCNRCDLLNQLKKARVSWEVR